MWLNGEKVYDIKERWTGWHAGKERVPVELRAGENTLAIEALDGFFVSLTDDRDWSLTSREVRGGPGVGTLRKS